MSVHVLFETSIHGDDIPFCSKAVLEREYMLYRTISENTIRENLHVQSVNKISVDLVNLDSTPSSRVLLQLKNVCSLMDKLGRRYGNMRFLIRDMISCCSEFFDLTIDDGVSGYFLREASEKSDTNSESSLTPQFTGYTWGRGPREKENETTDMRISTFTDVVAPIAHHTAAIHTIEHQMNKHRTITSSASCNKNFQSTGIPLWSQVLQSTYEHIIIVSNFSEYGSYLESTRALHDERNDRWLPSTHGSQNSEKMLNRMVRTFDSELLQSVKQTLPLGIKTLVIIFVTTGLSGEKIEEIQMVCRTLPLGFCFLIPFSECRRPCVCSGCGGCGGFSSSRMVEMQGTENCPRLCLTQLFLEVLLNIIGLATDNRPLACALLFKLSAGGNDDVSSSSFTGDHNITPKHIPGEVNMSSLVDQNGTLSISDDIYLDGIRIPSWYSSFSFQCSLVTDNMTLSLLSTAPGSDDRDERLLNSSSITWIESFRWIRSNIQLMRDIVYVDSGDVGLDIAHSDKIGGVVGLWVIVGIRPPSTALNLKLGSVIISINGQPVHDLSLVGIHLYMTPRPLVLTINDTRDSFDRVESTSICGRMSRGIDIMTIQSGENDNHDCMERYENPSSVLPQFNPDVIPPFRESHYFTSLVQMSIIMSIECLVMRSKTPYRANPREARRPTKKRYRKRLQKIEGLTQKQKIINTGNTFSCRSFSDLPIVVISDIVVHTECFLSLINVSSTCRRLRSYFFRTRTSAQNSDIVDNADLSSSSSCSLDKHKIQESEEYRDLPNIEGRRQKKVYRSSSLYLTHIGYRTVKWILRSGSTISRSLKMNIKRTCFSIGNGSQSSDSVNQEMLDDGQFPGGGDIIESSTSVDKDADYSSKFTEKCEQKSKDRDEETVSSCTINISSNDISNSLNLISSPLFFESMICVMDSGTPALFSFLPLNHALGVRECGFSIEFVFALIAMMVVYPILRVSERDDSPKQEYHSNHSPSNISVGNRGYADLECTKCTPSRIPRNEHSEEKNMNRRPIQLFSDMYEKLHHVASCIECVLMTFPLFSKNIVETARWKNNAMEGGVRFREYFLPILEFEGIRGLLWILRTTIAAVKVYMDDNVQSLKMAGDIQCERMLEFILEGKWVTDSRVSQAARNEIRFTRNAFVNIIKDCL